MMMNDRYKKTYWAGLLALLLTGCAQDTVESQRRQAPVTFTLEIGKAGTRGASTIDNVWPNSSTISISNSVNTYQYKTSSSSGAEAGGEPVEITPKDAANIFYWPIDDPQWKFEAWFPSEGTSAISSWSVEADQRVQKDGNGISEDIYLAQDMLYCPPTPASFWQPVNLVFYHQLARVIVVVNTDNTEKKEQVTGISLGISGDGNNQIGLSGTIKTYGTAVNGTTVWETSNAGAIQMRDRTERGEDGKSDNNLYTYECMVIPQAYDSQKGLFGIATTGATDALNNPEDLTYTYKDTFNSETVFRAGYQYTFNLVVSSKGVVSVSSLQVIDWSSESIPDLTADVPTAGY